MRIEEKKFVNMIEHNLKNPIPPVPANTKIINKSTISKTSNLSNLINEIEMLLKK